MATKIMPVSDLRRNASEVLTQIRKDREAIYITQHGRPAAVLVDYLQYEAMLAQLEDLADLAALDAAIDEPQRDYDEYLDERAGHK